MAKFGWLALLVFAGTAIAAAPAKETTKPEAQKMPAPAINEATQRLIDGFQGRWEGRGTKTATGQQAKAVTDIRVDCSAVASNHGVLCNYQATDPEMGPVRDAHLMGIDPDTNLVHAYAVTSTGQVYESTGAWTTKGLQFTSVDSMDGKPFTDELTFQWEGKDRLRVRDVMTFENGETQTFDVELQRLERGAVLEP